MLAVFGGGAAQATTSAASGEVSILGGTPQGTCPSGNISEVAAIDEILHPDADYLDAGFYASVGYYWPPYTTRLCETVYDPAHGFNLQGGGTCQSGRLPFWIPEVIPGGYDQELTVEWGLYLPAGWYEHGTTTLPGGIVLCWSPTPF